jgi:hypothetical protein
MQLKELGAPWQVKAVQLHPAIFQQPHRFYADHSAIFGRLHSRRPCGKQERSRINWDRLANTKSRGCTAGET